MQQHNVIVADPGGLDRLGLFALQQDPVGNLVLDWKSLEGEREGRSLLMSEVDSIEFSYFNHPDAQHSDGWTSNWMTQDENPALIQLVIVRNNRPEKYVFRTVLF